MQNTFTVGGKAVHVITPPEQPTWRVRDVAAYFNVSRKAVYNWVYAELLPVHRTPGGGLRFIESEVKAAQLKQGEK